MVKEKINYGYLIGYFSLFLFLPPFIGLPLVLFLVWKKKNLNFSDYLLLIFCIAIYMGAINATKAPNGDQVNYYVAYTNVPSVGFIKSLIYLFCLYLLLLVLVDIGNMLSVSEISTLKSFILLLFIVVKNFLYPLSLLNCVVI